MAALVASGAPVFESWSHSQVNLVQLVHVWTIMNFSVLPQARDEALISATFPNREEDTVQWQLEIYPRGVIRGGSDDVSLFLRLNKSGRANTGAKCGFHIVDSENNRLHSMSIVNLYWLKVGDGWGFIPFVKRSTLLTSTSLLQNDTLRLLCEVSYTGDVALVSGPRGNPKAADAPQSPLAEDLGRLLESHEMADAVLVARGEEFPAHRAILAARSSVLAAIFAGAGPTSGEQSKVRVELGDLDREVVKEMLRFVYTDSTPNLATLAKHLLPVADKLAIEGLKTRCEQRLGETVDADNAAKLLILAESLSANRLRLKIVDFAIAHAEDVTNAASFESLSVTHPHLAAEILSSIVMHSQGER